MRLVFVSSLLFIISVSSTFAQNVGIGESSPANKISVKGNLSVGSGYTTTTAPTDGAIIQGSVGVGTTSPYQKVSVLTTGGLYSGNEFDPHGFSVLTGTTAGTDFILYMGADKTNSVSYLQSVKWGASTADLSLNARGGNVGIGTPTPGQALDVNGTTKTVGFQMTGGASNGYILQSDVSGTGTWVSPAMIAGQNIYNTNGTLTGPRTVTMGANSLTFSTTGGNMVLGSGDATGAPAGGILRGPNAGSGNTAGGTLTLNAGFGFGSGAGGSVFMNGGTSGSGTNGNIYLRGGFSSGAQGAVYLNDDHGGNNFLNAAGGITTIGSGSAGSAQLSIANGLALDNAGTNNGTISSLNTVTTGNAITFGSTGSGEGIASNRANATAGQNQYGLDIYTSFARRLSVTNAGRVGIGTTNPQTIAEISGGTTELLKLTSTTGGAGNKAYIDFQTFAGTSVNARIGAIDMNSNNGGLIFETGNVGSASTTTTERMRILNGGNVGINTTVPSNILNVGAGNTQGIDIGNPNDQLNVAGGGSYAIRFYGYRDVVNYAVQAKIQAQRTYQCCAGAGTLPWLSQGTDLVFYTNNVLSTGGSSGVPSDNSSERLRIKDNGYVGIGTSNPVAPFHLSASGPSASGSGRFFNSGGGINTGSTWGNEIAYFQGGDVLCNGGFVSVSSPSFSDARIKKVIGISDSKTDLDLLKSIEITKYTYIDTLGIDTKVHTKVIAQQVEKVFPEAVDQKTNYLPEVYAAADHFNYDPALHRLTVILKGTHDFKTGDMIEWIDENNTYQNSVVTDVMDRNSFTLNTDQSPKKVFVYGKQVKDFRVVDYQALGMLNISATQELAKQLKEEQAKNQKLEQELYRLKKQNNNATQDIEKLKASVETLQQIVGAKAQK